MKQHNRKSYLGEACAAALNLQMEKMIEIDKGVVYANKEKITIMEDKMHALEGEVNSYQIQGE